MLKFILDGSELVDQPIGWKDFSTRLSFDKDNRTLLFDYPNDLTFIGDGYKILRDAKAVNPCSVIDVIIQSQCSDQTFKTISNGKVFVTDIVFNRHRCTAQVQVTDNSFSALIKNNWNIRTNLGVDKTKSGLDITATTDAVSLDIHKPTPNIGTTIIERVSAFPDRFENSGNRRGFDLGVAFGFLVDFMSDGQLTFQSDWYDNLPNNDKICVVNGRELRLGATLDNLDPDTVPFVSFFDLWDYVSKAFNLVIYVEGTVIRIEEISVIRDSNDIVELDDVKDVEESYDQSVLYASIKFGGKSYINEGSFPKLTLYTHNEEEFHFDITCNVDSQLDLSSNRIIVDSNTIESLVVLGGSNVDSEAFDKDIFLIQYEEADEESTVYTLSSVSPPEEPFLYNGIFMNVNIADRYNFMGALAKYLPGDGGDRFRALASPSYTTSVGAGGVTENPFVFADDFSDAVDAGANGGGFDEGGNYTLSSRYTIAFNGVYTFHSIINSTVNIVAVGSGIATFGYEMDIKLIRYSSGGVELESFEVSTGNQGFNPIYTAQITKSIYGIVGDYIEVSCTLGGIYTPIDDDGVVPTISFDILDTSKFEMIEYFNGGGVYEEGDFNEYYAVKLDFEKSLSHSEIEDIQGNPTRSINISDNLGTLKGFPDDISIKLYTGEVDWSLRSKENFLIL